MQALATVTQEKQPTATPRVTQASSTGGTATFVDNRPSTVYQRTLQEAMTVQRSTTVPHTSRRNPQGSARFQHIATAMGSNYGVDTSGLVATHNSSFPGSLNAAATIQGRNIHFAPGMDTDHNIRHEVAHAIDNTLHGTPKGYQVVQGQRVDTTREKVVDRMAQRTLGDPTQAPGGSLIQTMRQGYAATAEALSRDVKFCWSQGGDTHKARFTTTLTKPQWATPIQPSAQARLYPSEDPTAVPQCYA